MIRLVWNGRGPVDRGNGTYRVAVRRNLVTVCVCGDVMTGRGVDQILPGAGDPALWERHVRDARAYVELAEQTNGPIPHPVDATWPWGDSLTLLDEVDPDVRLINLETSITRSDDVAAGKAVHYRMSPDNVECLAVASPDACALANNHLLDFGHQGLEDTLEALRSIEASPTGAGRDASEAARPAVVSVGNGNRVWIFSVGDSSSGIPRSWAATDRRPGIDLLPDLSPATAASVADRVRRVKEPGDVVVASIHWGTNWGYDVPAEHVRFAHRLIDAGVDVVHGHSSHHPRPMEVHRGKLILYGCGDLLNDYEGIPGREEYRDDLRLLYFLDVAADTGNLVQVRMAPLQARRMQLRHASGADSAHLQRMLNRINHGFGVYTEIDATGMLSARPRRRR